MQASHGQTLADVSREDLARVLAQMARQTPARSLIIEVEGRAPGEVAQLDTSEALKGLYAR
jgi:hypothetical protein